MGHEIAHVTARHGAERMSQNVLVALGGAALDVALHDKDSRERELWSQAYGLGATFGYVLPFSRLNESEADEIGLRYAARAGYDPRAAIIFWQRMKEASEAQQQKPPEWISTHPSDETRIKKLEQLMPAAVEEYEKALVRRQQEQAQSEQEQSSSPAPQEQPPAATPPADRVIGQ